MIGGRVVSVALASILAAPPEGPPEPPPGGYWQLAEQREPEPRDGRQSLLVGAILTPLGLLRIGGAASTVYVAQDGRCQRLLEANDDSCNSLRLWGYSGLAMGGLMFTTGVVFLGLGFHRRRVHDAWRRRYSISVTPTAGRVSRGLSLTLRF